MGLIAYFLPIAALKKRITYAPQTRNKCLSYRHLRDCSDGRICVR